MASLKPISLDALGSTPAHALRRGHGRVGPVTLAFNNEPVQAHYCAQAQRGAVSSEKTPLARGEVGLSIEYTSSISASETAAASLLPLRPGGTNQWLAGVQDVLTLRNDYKVQLFQCF